MQYAVSHQCLKMRWTGAYSGCIAVPVCKFLLFGFDVTASFPRGPPSSASLGCFANFKACLSPVNHSVTRYQRECLDWPVQVHVSMLYSCRPWHTHPHGLPELHLLHTGSAPVVWYALPAKALPQLEAAYEELMPEAVESRPDLLHSGTTMPAPLVLLQVTPPLPPFPLLPFTPRTCKCSCKCMCS